MAACTGPRTAPRVLCAPHLPSHFPAPGPPILHVRNNSSHDRTPHSLQRSLSWSSLQDSLKGFEASTMGVLEPKTSVDKKPAPPLASPGSTLDMAYFLRNTGPPASRNPQQLGEKKANMRHLNLFKKRKHSTSGLLSKEPSLNSFTPPEGVIQKVSKDGKKYFQIVANASTFGSADLSKINRPQRLSVTFSDRTDIIGTETLDSWISTFSPGHHELPLSKPPSYEIARDSSEASGTPKKASSVEPAPPQLPAVDSGFGLSIVDDPAFGISPPDTVNASMALGSNPPSLSTSLDHLSINRSHSHDALPTGPDKANVVEQKSRPQTADQLFNVSVSAHPTKKPSVDRLAGQGMRRPLLDRVRYHCTPTKSSSRENRPSSQHSSLERPRSNIKYDSPNTDPTPETRSNAAQLAKLRREQKVRARKLREVQQAREKLENKNHADLEEVTTTKLTKTRARTNQTNYENAASRFSQLTISDECSTPQMPPPPPHTNEVIPIMVVAEQVPTPLKARPSKKQKPARLNLRDANQTSRSSTIAVRSESPTLSPSIRTGITQISASPQIEPAQVSTSSSSQPSPDNTSPTVANLHTISMRRAKSAREPACQTHIPGSILNTAFPAPPSSFQRISIASRDRCTTSVSKGSRPESRLESRIEALERENRLFEAALMAVLRTSGTLNGCPCYVLSKTGGAAKERGRKDGDWERGRTRERVQRDPGVEALKAKRESGVSDCSEESGVSALEVYLGTRMGAKVGGMGN